MASVLDSMLSSPKVKVKVKVTGSTPPTLSLTSPKKSGQHDYTIDTLDVLKACDACADMGQL